MSLRALRPCLLLIATAVAADGDAARSDAPGAFEGYWVVDASEMDGRGPERGFIGYVTIRGDTIDAGTGTFVGGWTEKGTFAVVEAGKTSSTVDVKGAFVIGGDHMKPRTRALLSKELWRRVDPTTFQRCVFLDEERRAKERPGAFATAKGDSRIILTYKRARPPSP